MSDETLLDFDTMDDVSLDDIPEAPDFLTEIPTGTYILCVESAGKKKTEDKEGKEKSSIVHIYSVFKTLELDDMDELAPAEGSKFSERWTNTEDGRSYWKKQARKLLGKESLQGFTFGDTFKALSDSDNPVYVKAKCSTKPSKGKDGKDYMNIQVRVIEKLADPAVE